MTTGSSLFLLLAQTQIKYLTLEQIDVAARAVEYK